jgi:2-oxoglutarate dehydrogenase E2 component (dihydrolipoamide succinyltransferase)
MAKVDVEMPKMGESITEGTVIAWHKEPGEMVEQDETILEIGTDKVDTEVPSPAEGTLVEHLVEEGDTVEVGTIIARIETEPEAAADAPSDAPPTDESDADEAPPDEPTEETTESAPEPEPEPEPVETGDGDAPEGDEVEVVMPKMGESITEGTVIAWFKDLGDEVEVDETLLEIGTDKVDTEVPSPAAGVLKEKRVEEGETVEVGTVIAILASEVDADSVEPPTPEEPADEDSREPEPADASTAAAPSSPSGDGAVSEPDSGDREPVPRRDPDGRFYSPLVRSIAKEEGLSLSDLQSIDGSGREGRVTKEDVLGYLEQQTEAPSEPASAPTREAEPATPSERPPQPSRPAQPQRGDYSVEGGPSEAELKQQYGDRIEIAEMDRMRKITAEHMVRSKATSAHVTSFAEADVTGLVNFREANKEAFHEREGIKLTYTPFFVKAAVEALRKHPVLNASVEGDKIVMKKDFHVGIAVAIGQKGLLAPVIRNAGDLNIVGLARRAGNMAERARNKELQPDELQGGTFTVTNIGSLGSLMGTPIINQPQVGILATGTIQKRPVVVEDDDLGDVITIRHMMYLSLSYDHRIIDGAMGASFLQRVVEELESFSEGDTLF